MGRSTYLCIEVPPTAYTPPPLGELVPTRVSARPHISVAYLGRRSLALHEKASVVCAMLDVVGEGVDLPITLDGSAGLKAFEAGDDGFPLYVPVIKSPELMAFQSRLLDTLVNYGVQVDHTFPDFTPHVTWGWFSAIPATAIIAPAATFSADTISLHGPSGQICGVSLRFDSQENP